MRKTVQKLYSILISSTSVPMGVFALLLLAPQAAAGMTVEDFSVHMNIMQLHESREPFIVSDHVVFSYKQPAHDNPPRYVAAAFQHEGFRELHLFARNQHGVFVLALPVPRDIERMVYRLRVDGTWLADPVSSERLQDSAGRNLSAVVLPEVPESRYRIPEVDPAGKLQLVYHDDPGMSVYVAGSFNNWDPFMHRMREHRPGEYRISLRVNPERRQYYVFYVNGKRVLDPTNPEVAFSARDTRVSVVLTSEHSATRR